MKFIKFSFMVLLTFKCSYIEEISSMTVRCTGNIFPIQVTLFHIKLFFLLYKFIIILMYYLFCAMILLNLLLLKILFSFGFSNIYPDFLQLPQNVRLYKKISVTDILIQFFFSLYIFFPASLTTLSATFSFDLYFQLQTDGTFTYGYHSNTSKSNVPSKNYFSLPFGYDYPHRPGQETVASC